MYLDISHFSSYTAVGVSLLLECGFEWKQFALNWLLVLAAVRFDEEHI